MRVSYCLGAALLASSCSLPTEAINIRGNLKGLLAADSKLDPSASLGCFIDQTNRDLPLANFQTYSSDPAADCAKKCRAALGATAVQHIGLQWHNECYCGTNAPKYGAVDASECDTPCASMRQMCGGEWRNTVYRLTPVPAQVTYQGCYIDQSSRELSLASFTVQSADPLGECVSKCRAVGKGVGYVGLQWHDECYCGSDTAAPGKYGKASETECNTPCMGASALMCGGGWRNSVYTIPKATYLGCYVDQSDRDFSMASFTVDSVDPLGECIAKCKSSPDIQDPSTVTYVGLQWYNQCYCGGATPQYDKTSNDECNTPCSGASWLMCGGEWRNSVYALERPATESDANGMSRKGQISMAPQASSSATRRSAMTRIPGKNGGN